MPDLDDISYLREETFAAFAGFYELLQKMYLPDGQVIYPPPGGWPSIVNADPTLVETFGKSDEVIALLAHLPYVRSTGDWSEDPDAIPRHHLANWRYHFDYHGTCLASEDSSSSSAIKAIDHLRRTAEGDLSDLGLPHIVGIALSSYDDAPVIILDTERGVILWDESTCPTRFFQDYPDRAVPFDDPESDDEMAEEEYDFRSASGTWAIPDFFEILKDQFISLRWVPAGQFAVRSDDWSEGLPGEANMTAMCQSVFRKHGWPDLERYSKVDCLAEIQEAVEEQYPDHVDHRS
ncbi:hypothetical protein V8F06_009985 [Rhypophila decipiens]